MVNRKEALELHSKNPGKITVEPSIEIEDKEDLAMVYTPGVAEPCKEIAEDKENAYKYTSKGNLVAVVSDGSAVLGLGDIGPEASMPVMEGKANLMKKFGEVDGFPEVINADSADDIIEHVERMAPTYGAINLEDIKAPRCFKAEEALKKSLDIPVFHDDQHGTAIVVGAAVQNALELSGRALKDSRIVISGAGASGMAVANFLLDAGAENILPLDSSGILRTDDENEYKADLAKRTLASEEQGSLEDAMAGADMFIGLSAPGIVSQEMVESMAEDPVVFALANPEPEIYPDQAKEAGAFITATGRSDFDNQVNNSIAFPGVFRGALDVKASDINEEMKIAASEAIRNFIEPEKDKILPETLDKELAMVIAEEVAEAARESGVARQ
ncbi:NAD(P)-dependent malic enzyme [Candidatus Nanohalovita haloferacivicina]|uniref:NAD(P)-dependent malic enzyme n=1 Tax=Candidatus Nanohalovita haloferacivicina TaxID=2978046 RepID=UPI00325F9F9C|nr:Malate dehydrogenase (oxaloacetate-decarboxylating) [Candidatus Nanohalobia archaeon BNXNv]